MMQEKPADDIYLLEIKFRDSRFGTAVIYMFFYIFFALEQSLILRTSKRNRPNIL